MLKVQSTREKRNLDYTPLDHFSEQFDPIWFTKLLQAFAYERHPYNDPIACTIAEAVERSTDIRDFMRIVLGVMLANFQVFKIVGAPRDRYSTPPRSNQLFPLKRRFRS